jgi:hypothetical protein
MKTLMRLLGDAWLIVGQQFVLLYPLLLFPLLLSPLIAQAAATGVQLDWKWVLLLATLVLLYYAFVAGWFSMIAQAVKLYVGQEQVALQAASDIAAGRQPAEEVPVNPFIAPFRLFGAFLPGVGQFFASFALGGGLQLTVMLALVFGMHTLIEQGLGYPPGLDKFATFQSQAEANAFLLQLNPAQQEQFVGFIFAILGAIFAYGVFYLLTMLWAAYVVVYEVGAFRAYWMSIRRFFKDPFRLLLIAVVYASALMATAQLMTPGDSVFRMMLDFLLILIKTLFSVVLVLYVYRVKQAETPVVESLGGAEHPPSAASS